MSIDVAAIMDRVSQDFPDTVARLAELVRIPSCSFPGYDGRHLHEAADATAAWLRDAGFPDVELLNGSWPSPYVVARDHRAGADAPTLLLYAHYDVQPTPDEDAWASSPYSPEQREGRLYGRGSADDKAGIAAHAAACSAWRDVAGSLPINITVLVEGEEEVGSPHLEDFLAEHLEKLRCDALVIADIINVQRGLPSITASLRGMITWECTVRVLDGPVHSGLWGGAVPDPVQALARMITGLTDGQGALSVPGVAVPEPDPALLESLRAVPYDAAETARSMGARPAAESVLADGARVYRSLWCEPQLSVNAMHAGGQPGQIGNVVVGEAYARLSLRLVPGMDAHETAAKVEAHVRDLLPQGVELDWTCTSTVDAWATATDHPIFATAIGAFAAGYEREPVIVGSGGSIPFVGVLSERLGGVPALLVPVEDPDSNPHGVDESVALDDLEKTTRSIAALIGMAKG